MAARQGLSDEERKAVCRQRKAAWRAANPEKNRAINKRFVETNLRPRYYRAASVIKCAFNRVSPEVHRALAEFIIDKHQYTDNAIRHAVKLYSVDNVLAAALETPQLPEEF